MKKNDKTQKNKASKITKNTTNFIKLILFDINE